MRTKSTHRPARTARTDEACDASLLPLEPRVVMSGNGFFDAIPLHIGASSGEAAATGQITGSGQRFYRFTADQDGLTALVVSPKIPLNATLEVYDSSGRLLARPAVRAGSGQAEGMIFEAFEGREYFVRVLRESGTRGRFGLTIDGARELDVSHGDVSVRDRLDFRGDEDGYNFTPDRTGRVTITLDPTGSLDAQIRVYNAAGGLVTGVVDRAGSGGDEIVSLNVRAGDTYRVVVTGRNGAQGAYTISFDPHFGYGGSNGTGPGGWYSPISSVASSAIDFAGDEDLFSFVAGRSGSARIIADAGWGLDVALRVYDSHGSLLASRDRTGVSGAEIVDLSVQSGRRYYIVVDGYRASTGQYTLTLQAPVAPPPPRDDHANAGQFSYATRIPILASSGNGLGGGVIESYGDTDLFKITAAGSGTLWVRINPHAGLDAIARAYDSRGYLVTSADSGGSGRAEWLRLDVIRGETFFLLVDGYGSSTGGYDVEIDGPSWW